MIKCPNADCGFENVDGTQYCEACGEELPQNTGAAPMTQPGTNDIECPECGNMNPADNAVCEVCGADLHPGGTGPTPGLVQAVGTTPPIGVASGPSTNTGDGGIGAGNIGSSTPFDAAIGATPTTGTNPTGAPDSTGLASPPISATMGDTGSGTGTVLPTNLAPDLSGLGSNMAGGLSTPVVATGDATAPVTSPGLPPVPAAPDTTPATTALPSTTTLPDPTPPAVVPVAPVAPGQELQPGKVKLTVEQGMMVGAQFVLGDSEMLVGREDTEEDIYPDLDLGDQDAGYVHRRHAQLNFEDGHLFVTHLGGVNKTRINNRPLPDNVRQEVKLGDKIAFGKVVLRLAPA